MRRGRKAPFSCDPNAMPEPIARLYLATPPVADAEAFAPRLAEACAAGEVVAVLLRLEAADERTLVKRVKALAPAAQEAGADYLLFGEPRPDGSLPPLDAVVERAAWWAEIFETPCVAFAPSLDAVPRLAATGAEFVAIADAVWDHPDGPAAAIRAALAALPTPAEAR